MAKFPTFGKRLYPSPTGGRSVRIGQTTKVRCRHCGQVNDNNTTTWANQGEGAEEFTDSDGVKQIRDTGGCGLCHSYNWKKSKPQKIYDPSVTGGDSNG